MGKSKKLPPEMETYLRDTAKAMPAVPVIQVLGDGFVKLPTAVKKVMGSTILAADPKAQAKDPGEEAEDVIANKVYVQSSSSVKYVDHYKKLKKAYLKDGVDGCNLYIKHCYKVLAQMKPSDGKQ